MKRALFALLLCGCEKPAPPPAPGPVASAPPPFASPAPPPSPAAIAPPPAFEAVIGEWKQTPAGFEVDGSSWKPGTVSPDLASAARSLFGDKYAAFVEGAKPTFPLAIQRDLPPDGDLRISVRFLPRSGKIDQAAGIAFGIGEDGSYFGARANALENNVLLFEVVRGKRTVVAEASNVETKSGEWHTLAVDIVGKNVTVEVDGKKPLKNALRAQPKGHVGLWSKADSRVTFDAFTIVPLVRTK
jgi:hypothetical protein